MRIANNVMAMNTHRFYSSNNATVSKSAEKLSSGYRVNRAGDDAAGLAISEKMRAQVRGMNMASKNSQDAVSLVQTAEGALQEVHSMLQRMNEMAVQSASGTNQNLDRQALNLEFTNLRAEIDQVATTTNFNERALLNGGSDVQATFTAAAGSGSAITFNDAATNVAVTTDNLQDSAIQTAIGAKAWEAGTASLSYGLDAENHVTMSIGSTIIGRSATALGAIAATGTDTYAIQDASGNALGNVLVTSTSNGAATVDQIKNSITNQQGGPRTYAVTRNAGTGLTLQVGATSSETLNVSIKAMNTTGLGINATTIETEANARHAITTTKEAINTVSTQRATLGALQNRLEHKISNLDNTSENLSAAESRIRDVDMAKEMTAFTKNNILSQAATAMLAQANSSPQNVLSLLR